MARLEIVAAFDGDLASEHKLPANEASQSIYGITRSILIPTNYLFEGRVRRRRFDPHHFQVNIIAQRPGSFETVYEILFDPAVLTAAGAIGAGVAANFLSDFITSLVKRATGGSASDRIEELEHSQALNSGDLAALVDAIEPSMRMAHVTIEQGAQIIQISGDNNIVNLNSATKRYVNHTVRNDEIRIRLFSVASFNSNTGYGRIYDSEERRTIPFQIPADFDANSVSALLHSFSNYARRRLLGDENASLIAMTYRTIEDAEGTVKKILPVKARLQMEDL